MFKYMYNILQLGFSIGWYLYQDCLPSITESWRRTCRWRLHEHEVDEDRIDAFQVWCPEKILSGLLKPWFVLFGTKCALYSSHDECFFGGDNSQFKQELVLILGWNYPSVNLHSIRFELSGFLHQVDYTSAPLSFWIQLKYVIQPCPVSKWIGVNLISQNNPKHEITKSKITKIQIRSGPER